MKTFLRMRVNNKITIRKQQHIFLAPFSTLSFPILLFHKPTIRNRFNRILVPLISFIKYIPRYTITFSLGHIRPIRIKINLLLEKNPLPHDHMAIGTLCNIPNDGPRFLLHGLHSLVYHLTLRMKLNQTINPRASNRPNFKPANLGSPTCKRYTTAMYQAAPSCSKGLLLERYFQLLTMIHHPSSSSSYLSDTLLRCYRSAPRGLIAHQAAPRDSY
mmetsp:Transcript_32905/g.52477  ORF Transcript_32905/g.52477 Transcript_32905/m.52477 type:complete len:216 (+) Transcript_32905:10801-11448(+)